MPELPDIAAMADSINDFCADKSFNSIIKNPKNKNIEVQPPSVPFKVRALSRGKELKLILNCAGKKASLMMQMGLTGGWVFLNSKSKESDKEANHCQLTFQAVDGSKFLFVDKLKYGRWVWGDWNPERSPDPVQDFDGFCENIKNAFSRPRTVTSFKKKPICEALLDQDYFNGIGNYLRAEILYHANIHPKESTYNALLLEDKLPSDVTKCPVLPDPKTFDFRKSIVLKLCLGLCDDILMEQYDSKYVSKDNKTEKKKFVPQCYNSDKAKTFTDAKKRTVWYMEHQRFVLTKESTDKENEAPIITVGRKRKASVLDMLSGAPTSKLPKNK